MSEIYVCVAISGATIFACYLMLRNFKRQRDEDIDFMRGAIQRVSDRLFETAGSHKRLMGHLELEERFQSCFLIVPKGCKEP